MAEPVPASVSALNTVLDDIGRAAVAVSGGVDSMTLALLAGRRSGADCAMFHAVSPAVPAEATARVQEYAVREGWRLTVLDAGEFDDPAYRANPANRCFYCKTNLYGALAARTDATLLSGTNVDDLGDWRPGLKAAQAHGVRHPFVEAGIDKAQVRSIAAGLASTTCRGFRPRPASRAASRPGSAWRRTIWRRSTRRSAIWQGNYSLRPCAAASARPALSSSSTKPLSVR